MGARMEQAIAVLNGLVGDYLARERNGLATEMALYLDLLPIELTRAGLARAYPEPTPRVAVLVHGVMCTETVWRFPDGRDYGRMLQADLGITPVYVRYNSGRAIADNGEELSGLLQTLVDVFPGPLHELILIGYSMGGLLLRSACHVASEHGHTWLGRVQRAIYVGTPHLGAPAERAGRALASVLRAVPDPYTRLIADLGDLRSEGVKDLGDAALRHADRAPLGATALSRWSLRDARHPVPLLPGIRHALVAGSLSSTPLLRALFGDSLVPVRSATAHGMLAPGPDFPSERLQVLTGRSHLALAHDPEVYGFIKQCCDDNEVARASEE